MKISLKQMIAFLLLWFITIFNTAYAMPPLAPVLELNTRGLEVTAKWNYASDATGYKLSYAPTNNIANVTVVDLEEQTNISNILQNGESLFIAVQAYNEYGDSPLSNIEHFALNKRVLLFTEMVDGELTEARRKLQKAIKEEFNSSPAAERVNLEVVDVPNHEHLADVFYGLSKTDEKVGLRGYIDDPDVLAIITTSTSMGLAISAIEHENPPLIITATATSEILKDKDNVLLMAPSNDIQSTKMHQELSLDAKESNNMHKYIIILGDNPGIAIYSFDLNNHLLATSYREELSILSKGGKNNIGEVENFAQLVGTFPYDGSENSLQLISNMITTLDVDGAVYMGFPEQFNPLYNVHPEIKWIVGDGSYAHEDFASGDVRMMVFGGADLNNIQQNLGYDAANFLEKVVNALPDFELERDKLLQEAKATEYDGHTGRKGMSVKENGSYDVVRATADKWELVQHP